MSALSRENTRYLDRTNPEPATHSDGGPVQHTYANPNANASEAQAIVVRAYYAFVNVLTPFLAPYGLTPARLGVLGLLIQAEGKRLTMGDLTAQLSVTSNAATKLVAGLERDGWVRRTANPRDRRVIYAELIPEVEDRVKEIRSQTFNLIGAFWQPFTDEEITVVISVMSRLNSHVLSFAESNKRGS